MPHGKNFSLNLLTSSEKKWYNNTNAKRGERKELCTANSNAGTSFPILLSIPQCFTGLLFFISVNRDIEKQFVFQSSFLFASIKLCILPVRGWYTR